MRLKSMELCTWVIIYLDLALEHWPCIMCTCVVLCFWKWLLCFNCMVRLDRLKDEQQSEDALAVLGHQTKELHCKFRVIRCHT